METLQDTVELLEGESCWSIPPKFQSKLPKKTFPTLNEEQRVLDLYQTFKSQLLRWGVPERSKLFEDYFANCLFFCPGLTKSLSIRKNLNQKSGSLESCSQEEVIWSILVRFLQGVVLEWIMISTHGLVRLDQMRHR